MAKKNYVIDTSVFLTDADCIFRFQNNDIFVPLKVLEEIDRHKKRVFYVDLFLLKPSKGQKYHYFENEKYSRRR